MVLLRRRANCVHRLGAARAQQGHRRTSGRVIRPLSSRAGSDQRTTCPLFIDANYYAPTQTFADRRVAEPLRKNSRYAST